MADRENTGTITPPLPDDPRASLDVESKRDHAATALVAITNAAALDGDYRAAVAAVRALAELEGLNLPEDVANARRLDNLTDDQRRARLEDLAAKAKEEAQEPPASTH